MRPPALRIHEDELVVDNFAGGGGASLGIEWALGRSPDIAVNHDPEAVAMHAANHPTTRHYCESVWAVNPKAATGGRPVALAWFSPDCTHHSKARGGKPFRDPNKAKRSRALAHVVVRWARAVKPRVIILENVEEFEDWGPLGDDGKPDPARSGLSFRIWLGQLRGAGYVVELRQLRASDYGAPTSRKRLFIIARSDGLPIVWPEPTHGAPLLGLSPYRTAAECIDWSLECPSIFDRVRPLAENTLRRIARGLRKYVIEAAEPFIIPVTHAGDARVHSLREPMPTVTGAHRGEKAVISPMLIQTGWGERDGQAPRCLDLHRPLGVVPAGGVKHALVAAFLAKHYGGHEGPGRPLPVPFDTVTTIDHHSLVASHLMKLQQNSVGQDHREPMHTVMAGATRFAEVRAFLTKYYSTDQAPELRSPLATVTTRDRFGLVTVAGVDHLIADIGMRMLAPRELFRAQSFPDSYRIDVEVDGRPLSKTAQVRMCGNSVPPVMAAALARAQFIEGHVSATGTEG